MDLIEAFAKAVKQNITESYLGVRDLLISHSLLTDTQLESEREIKNHKVRNFVSSGNLQEIFSHLVMHGDLNPAETMYGGRMLELCDEAGCIFLFKKTKLTKFITTEMQNVYFLCSPKLGDIVTFYGEVLELKKASVWIRILAKNIAHENSPTVIDCQMRFMLLDNILTRKK